MVMIRFRSKSEEKDTLRKLKKMHKFVKELITCFEDNEEIDDDEDYRRYDDDEDYRYNDEDNVEHMRSRSSARGRYRRSM